MDQTYFATIQLAKRGYTRTLEPVCRRWELTRNEMDVLLYLANNPGFDRAADIVANRGMTKSHVSLSVSNLESRGILKRREDPHDRRTVRLELTEAAWEIAREGQKAQQAYFRQIFRNLSREEIDAWQTTIEKVCKNIEQMETE